VYRTKIFNAAHLTQYTLKNGTIQCRYIQYLTIKYVQEDFLYHYCGSYMHLCYLNVYIHLPVPPTCPPTFFPVCASLCPVYPACFKYLSVPQPPCLRASLQCIYIFTLFSRTIMPACLPACPFCRPTCVHNTFCPSVCMLACPSSFLVVSLPVCLPVCKCVPPASSGLHYATYLSNRSNYTLCPSVCCTCLLHLQDLTFVCPFVCIPPFGPCVCLSTCRLQAKTYFPKSKGREGGGLQFLQGDRHCGTLGT
jgi:hypothetical protein